jgi:hypothetical protein
MSGKSQSGVSRLRTPEFTGKPPSKSQLAVFAGYVIAAGVYVTVGVFYTDFLLSVFVGIAYLLLGAWLVPAGVRRIL